MSAVLNSARPRPGSSIDKAMRALEAEGAAMSRSALAAVIEQDDEEVDGLLRFGVRMGMLLRTQGDGVVTYALGDGVPLPSEDPQPVPAPAIQAAPAAAPAAPRLVSVTTAHASSMPSSVEATGATVDEASTASRMQWPGGYTTKAGGLTERLMLHLAQNAPHGGQDWVMSRDLADATGIARNSVQALLAGALRYHAVRIRRDDGRVWLQMGNGQAEPEEAQPEPDASPALKAVPQPVAPAAPAASLRGEMAQHQLADATAELLAHFDMEIARLEHNLRIVRRRREAVVTAAGAQS